ATAQAARTALVATAAAARENSEAGATRIAAAEATNTELVTEANKVVTERAVAQATSEAAEESATAIIQRAEETIAALTTSVSQMDASPTPDLTSTALVVSATAALAAAEETEAILGAERTQAEATSEAALAALAVQQTREATADAQVAALFATIAAGATVAADPGPGYALATARADVTRAVATTSALRSESAAQETRIAVAELSGAALATEVAASRETATRTTRVTASPTGVATATVTARPVPSSPTSTIDITATSVAASTRSAASTVEAGLRAELATSQALATVLVAENRALSTAQAASPVSVVPEAEGTTETAAAVAPPEVSGAMELFVADVTTDWDGWSMPAGWSERDGMLVSDGSGRGEWLLPPFAVEGRDDYVVEAEMRLDGDPDCASNAGLAARGGDETYVAAGPEWACAASLRLWNAQGEIGRVAATLAPGWHTYRLEVRGATARLSIDGDVVLSGPAGAAAGGQVAVWSSGVALSLRAFRVVEVAST
ncbi:MAG: hypothetical protein M3R06_07370, partial [Chloroflexota bacterium]|nr:hypothetical protein [Chloroflexota bacterium]